ncbi:MAG: NlpC/P60 family protein [Actinomycetia bacterium]|nr:NlpC/P60 family protein [Actinomycetes bacterium]
MPETSLRRRALKRRASCALRRLLAAASASILLLSAALATAPPTAAVPLASAPAIGTEVIGQNGSDDAAQSPEAAAISALPGITAQQKAALLRLYKKLDAINQETEIASEQYNAAQHQLDTLNADIATQQKNYELLNKAYQVAAEAFGKRAAAAYRDGGYSSFLLLFDSKSFSEFYSHLEYLSVLNDQDARLISTLRSKKAELADTLAQLKQKQASVQSLEFELAARKIEIEERNAQRQESLKNQDPTLRALYSAALQASDAAQRQLAYSITAGKLADVSVEPNSPAELALACLGTPYVWGGASPAGFDCSGLMLYVFAPYGVNLPHSSAAQAQLGTPVTGPLQQNDAIFFGSPIHHVALYLGGGYYIEAPYEGKNVCVSKITDPSSIVAARRYDWKR